MFTPNAFSASDDDALELIDNAPFAMLLNMDGSTPVMTHLPILREDRRLLGHLARANPHSQHLNGRAAVIFQGPHTYISPRWYVSGSSVPTWNYTAVHVTGTCRVIDNDDRKRSVIDRLVERFESDQWTVDWDDPYYARLITAISFFEIEIENISAAFKLSQNRSAADISAVIAALSESGDPADADVAKLMDQFAASK